MKVFLIFFFQTRKTSIHAGFQGFSLKFIKKSSKSFFNVIMKNGRYCSHAVMWWLKEAAIDRDVQVLFVRETNVGRIMEIMAEKIAARG